MKKRLKDYPGKLLTCVNGPHDGLPVRLQGIDDGYRLFALPKDYKPPEESAIRIRTVFEIQYENPLKDLVYYAVDGEHAYYQGEAEKGWVMNRDGSFSKE